MNKKLQKRGCSAVQSINEKEPLAWKREEERNWGIPFTLSHSSNPLFLPFLMLALQVARQKLKTRGSRNFGNSPFSKPVCDRKGQLE